MIIIGIILTVLGSLTTIGNWRLAYEWYRYKRHSSMFPLGGVILALGLYCLTSKTYAFLSICADLGTFSFFYAIPILIKDAWQISRFCLIRQLKSQSNHATYILKLFKGGIFVLNIDFDPLQVCNEHGAKIISSGMQGHWHQNNASILLTEYRDSRKTVLTKVNDSIYLSKESAYSEDKECKYDSLDNLEFQLL